MFAIFAALSLVFGSVFLFVTDTFNFSGAGFAAARDEDGFAFDTCAVLDAVTGAGLTVVFTVLTGAFTLPADLPALDFFTAAFAVDLAATDLVAVVLAFFAVSVVFAVFFIAFAMESVPTGALVAPS